MGIVFETFDNLEFMIMKDRKKLLKLTWKEVIFKGLKLKGGKNGNKNRQN